MKFTALGANIKVSTLTQVWVCLFKNNCELVDKEARGKITNSFYNSLQLFSYSHDQSVRILPARV